MNNNENQTQCVSQQKQIYDYMMQGNIGNAYAQTQVAEGFNAAGNNAGTNGMMGMGFGMGAMGAAGMNVMNNGGSANPIAQQMQQNNAPAQPEAPQTPETPAE